MSLPPTLDSNSQLSEKSVAAQAAEVEELRSRVAAAQARGDKPDAALLAQFANAQRAFLTAKIQLEQMRMAGLLAEPEPVVVAPVEAVASPAVEAPAAFETSPAAQTGGRLLSASRVFWLLVIFLLTALLWFMRSSFAGQ